MFIYDSSEYLHHLNDKSIQKILQIIEIESKKILIDCTTDTKTLGTPKRLKKAETLKTLKRLKMELNARGLLYKNQSKTVQEYLILYVFLLLM